VVVLAEVPGAFEMVCGITLLERLLRTLERVGVRHATVLTSDPARAGAELARPSWARAGVAVKVVGRAPEPVSLEALDRLWPAAEQRLLVVSASFVYDRRLLKLLAAAETAMVLADSSPPEALRPLFAGDPVSAALLTREWASAGGVAVLDQAIRHGLDEGRIARLDVAGVPRYVPSMRRELRPLFIPAPADAAGRRAAERTVLDSAQKQALDFPAYVHAPIETFLVSLLCRTSITPNQLSFWGNVLAYAGTALFATGRLGWGIVVALVVGVLDGVDGKQARVKVEDTRGGKLEHWFDGAFEVSWMMALAWWFWRSGQVPAAFWLMGLLFLAEAVDGVAKLLAIVKLGRQIDDVAPFDRWVRLVGGRRNVYIWILALFVVLGRPATGYVVIPWWEVATAAVHLPRALWLVARRPDRGARRGGGTARPATG
jgi:phosphatidylglycerophosphate synthase